MKPTVTISRMLLSKTMPVALRSTLRGLPGDISLTAESLIIRQGGNFWEMPVVSSEIYRMKSLSGWARRHSRACANFLRKIRCGFGLIRLHPGSISGVYRCRVSYRQRPMLPTLTYPIIATHLKSCRYSADMTRRRWNGQE